jgi:hypothetical protein
VAPDWPPAALPLFWRGLGIAGGRKWLSIQILEINDNLAVAVKLVRPVFVFRDFLNQLLMLLKGAHHRIRALQREVGQRRQSCRGDGAFNGHRSFGCEEPHQTLFRIIDKTLGLELEIQSPTPFDKSPTDTSDITGNLGFLNESSWTPPKLFRISFDASGNHKEGLDV